MNGICTFPVLGKTVKLFFGLIALERFKDKVKQYDLLSSKTYSMATIAHVVYAGYVNGCFMDDAPIEIPFSTFYETVETLALNTDFEAIHTAMASFEASKFVKGAAGQSAEAQPDEKKNPVTLTLNTSEVFVTESLG